MPLGAIIPVVVPIFAVILLFYLRYLYGDSFFESHGFGRDLNDENDTRILKLNLRIPRDQQPHHSERMDR